ncbi:MAG: nitrite reductase small subunit NirD [Aquabacterium sp.]|nr:nitrite reductase small subunit NirD [Aquabacterium sp.]
MTRWTAVCSLDDLPPLGARRIARAQGLPVAVFRAHDDRVYALLDRCPHKGGPLSQGLVAGDRVTCPLHGWTIGLADGSAQAPDEGRTPTFACRVETGVVYLDADELAQRALDACAPTAGPRACACACAEA